jgi:hypothetical protein
MQFSATTVESISLYIMLPRVPMELSIKHSSAIFFLLLPLTSACIPQFFACKESTLLSVLRQEDSLPTRDNARLFQNAICFQLT